MVAPVEIGKPLPRHGSFQAQATARSFWQRSDLCRWDFVGNTGPSGSNGATSNLDAKGYPILPRHEREPDDRFLRRLNQAMPRRVVKQIINRYNDHVCRQEIQRPEVGGAYGKLLEDATGTGMGLDALMRTDLRRAQVDGIAFLLADMSTPDPLATLAQDNATGRRPVVRLIKADQVPWWRDYEDTVQEAIITMVDADGVPYAWWVTPTECGRIDLKTDDRGKVTVTAFTLAKHEYFGCPLVRLAPEWDSEGTPGDDSMAAPLAESQKRILNIDSWLFEELQGNTFTTPVILGASARDMTDANGASLTIGPGMGLCIPNPAGGGSVSLAKLGSDPAQAASLREALNYEIEQLYRVAGLSPGNPTQAGAPESGVAKAFNFNEIETRLTALADAAAHAENLVIKRLSPMLGGYPGDAVWPNKFDAPDISAELDLTIRLLTAPQMPGVLRAKAVSAFAAKAFSFAPEEKAELQQQIEAMEGERVEVSQSPFNKPRPGGTGGDGNSPARMGQE